MTRLSSELHRLYGLVDGAWHVGGFPTRVLCLELGGAASWHTLGPIWRQTQLEWDWPAPAIAVSGKAELQLWFGFEEPQQQKTVAALQQQILASFVPDDLCNRVYWFPSVNSLKLHEKPLPPAEIQPGQWSAFVAPDLAGVFGDQPWLDVQPGHDSQADLLARLKPLRADELARALASGRPAVPASVQQPLDGLTAAGHLQPSAQLKAQNEAQLFLLDVMRDTKLDLHLRIQAAAALLQNRQA